MKHRLGITFLSIFVLIMIATESRPQETTAAQTGTGMTTRVSVDSYGVQGNSGGETLALSADGRFVAFMSAASNLVLGDTNNVEDIFVYDQQTGQTTRVSVDSSGVEGDDSSFLPTISADGRFVAFYSEASNLVAGDTNRKMDIFVRDRQTGQTTRVLVDEGSPFIYFHSRWYPAISADGRFVAFTSRASSLVLGDTNEDWDVFVHDQQTGETTLVSVDSSGVQGDEESFDPAISADGRFVAFTSFATNFPGDANYSNNGVFVHDQQTGETTLVSVDSSGVPGDRGSGQPSISADGRFVAFRSYATNFPGDTNYSDNVYVHDRQTGQTTRVSVDSSGAHGHGNFPVISADGRFVAFVSEAINLVPGDTNDADDIFIHDRQTGTTTRVSVDSSGVQGGGHSYEPAISADGRFVAFQSLADNLVPSDTNGTMDVFVHDRYGQGPSLYSISGRITTENGILLRGVLVSTATGSSTTDVDGNYTISDLPAGTYNLVATLPGYTFTPTTISVSVPSNASGQDFLGTPDAMTDTDGDGLLDTWEINGYHHDNGDIVNLPDMGADPFKPDIFVEVDWMEGHRPKDEAIRRIVRSFANAPVYDKAGNQIGTGINLHVDIGPDSIDYGRDEPRAWGKNGRGNKLDKYINRIPDSELRAITEQIQDGNFDQARRSIFHYNIWANKYDDQRLLTGWPGGVSLAVWEMPVFYVTLGAYSDGVGSVNEQAGTFMHELGHNLGLNHGGDTDDDDFNFKPNYLSVMNYSFQMGGLIIDGDDGCESCFDYSRFALPVLNEAQLIEPEGLNFPDTVTRSYGTKYFADFFPENRGCFPAAWDTTFVLFTTVKNAAGGINWNCNFFPPHIETSPVQEDINGKGGDSQLLTGYNDWANLKFSYAHTAVRGRSALISTFQVGDLSLLPHEITSDIDKTIPRLSESRVQLYAFVDSPTAAPHEILTYTVGAYTVDANSIDDFSPQFLMPPGFTYVPGSTTGVLTLEPETSGQELTWPPIAIPSDGSSVDFSFQVQAGKEQGIFFAAVRGTSNTSLVFPEDPVAPVQVGGTLFLPFVVEN